MRDATSFHRAVWEAKRNGFLLGVAVMLAIYVVACDASYTMRAICRGDTTPARDSVSLVKCSTLDTLVSRQ